MYEQSKTKLILWGVIALGVIAITVGTVVGAAGEHDPERDCVNGYCSSETP